jgi:peptidoglycan/LPS O-acetylase OafA/YrhL
MQKTIPSLNGLRAISIMMVIAYHYYQNKYFPDTKLVRYVGMFLFNGTLAVNIFFIISGFLITTLLINEENEYGSISLKNFYARRIIRIFPAYYFLLFVYFILNLIGYLHITTTGWLSILFFAKQFHYDSHETSHLWSLSVEEIFYLAWPLLFMQVGERKTIIILCLISMVTIIRIYKFNFPLPPLIDTIFTRGDALLIGCLFAIKYAKISSLITKYRMYLSLTIPLLIIFILFYNYLYKVLLNPEHTNFAFLLTATTYSLFGSEGMFTNLLLGIIIVFSINNRGTWFKLLNLPIMNHIGKLSYSLYLWQQLFTSERPLIHNLPLVLSIFIIYVLALSSYNLIERPFFKIKKYFVSRVPMIN